MKEFVIVSAAGAMPVWHRWTPSADRQSPVLLAGIMAGCVILMMAVLFVFAVRGDQTGEMRRRIRILGWMPFACMPAGAALAVAVCAVTPSLLTGLGLYGAAIPLTAIGVAAAALAAAGALAGPSMARRDDGKGSAVCVDAIMVFAVAFLGMLVVGNNGRTPEVFGRMDVDGQTVMATRCIDRRCFWTGAEDVAKATGTPVELESPSERGERLSADIGGRPVAWADADGRVHLQGRLGMDGRGRIEVLDEHGRPVASRPLRQAAAQAYLPDGDEDLSRTSQTYRPASGEGRPMSVLQPPSQPNRYFVNGEEDKGTVFIGDGPDRIRSGLPGCMDNMLAGIVTNVGYIEKGEGRMQKVLVLNLGGLRWIVQAPTTEADLVLQPA